VALAVAALCTLVLIAYSNSLSNGFVWDDHQQIVMNPSIRPDAPLTHLFTGDVRFASRGPSVVTHDYRPLQMFAYRLLLASFGASPTAFHAASILSAIAATLAAFAVFWLLTRNLGLAFAAAALFAVHPVHTEAVDWIASLPELGFTLFTLLAFAFFLISRNRTARPNQTLPSRWLFPSLSLLAFAIALLWKETAVVLPLLIALYVLMGESTVRNRPLTALKQSAPYWAVLAVYLILRLRVLGALSTSSPRDWALTPFQFLLTALHLMLSYWQRLALPIKLNAYYVFSPIRSLADPRAIAAILFTLAAVAAIIYLARQAPLSAFAALWVCLTLVPAMDLYALGRNPFTERYLYLPSVGFCLLVTLLAARLIDRLPSKLQSQSHKIAGISLIAVVAVYTAQSIARNPDWKDDATLFSQSLRLSPDAPFVRFMVASTQSSDPSQSAAAEQNYLQAIALATQQLTPDRLDAVQSYRGLASLYADRGQYDQALQTLAEARQLAPVDPDADAEQGMILARAGRGKEAQPLLERALAAQPDNENLLSALGLVARDDLHDLNRAATLFSRALAIHTENDDFSASLHNNLGAVYGDQGNFPSAIEQFQLAVKIFPTDPEYHTNLASALAAANRLPEARSEAETALRIAPGDPAARSLLERLSHP
jgi:tetratricopeptide (TPR) repeat protein